jgi:hypothetical protein
MTEQIKLKRKAKGDRPYFFEDPAVDKLLSMLMGLAGEVSIMRDRMDTIERLAGDKNLFSQDEIDDYKASDAVMEERAERREIYLGEITRIIQADLEGMADDNADSYEKVMDIVEKDME